MPSMVFRRLLEESTDVFVISRSQDPHVSLRHLKVINPYMYSFEKVSNLYLQSIIRSHEQTRSRPSNMTIDRRGTTTLLSLQSKLLCIIVTIWDEITSLRAHCQSHGAFQDRALHGCLNISYPHRREQNTFLALYTYEDAVQNSHVGQRAGYSRSQSE